MPRGGGDNEAILGRNRNMKGGVTKKISDTVTALDKKQLKKALYLTDRPKMERQHGYVEEAARTCLANKGKKEVCEVAIKQAREKVQDTISLPIDDTSLVGLEEYLSPAEAKPAEAEVQPEQEQPSDEELYDQCPECHIAVAASVFADICQEYPETQACKPISEKLADETTEPVDWIKAMIKTAEQTEGEPKKQMVAALGDLTNYLEKRDSPWLKELDKEVNNGKTTAIPTRAQE